MNTRSIRSNIVEARDELAAILALLDSGELDREEEFQVRLEHAYHHLNFAWHTRDVPDSRVVACEQHDFDAWKLFPVGDDWSLHADASASPASQ